MSWIMSKCGSKSSDTFCKINWEYCKREVYRGIFILRVLNLFWYEKCNRFISILGVNWVCNLKTEF